jgi:proline iminopeptidase
MKRYLSALTISVLLLLSSARAFADDDYQFVQSDGVRIAYRVFGSGLPLILINGGPGRSSDSFTELAQKISQLGIQVILFDQRGTGRSKLNEVSEKTVSLSIMVEDLEKLRQHLGLEKMSILGHSFGGMYAMKYASTYSEHVKSLILSASGGIDLSWQEYANTNMLSRLSMEKRAEYKFWTSPQEIQKDPAKARLEALRVLLPAYLYDQSYLPQIEEALLKPEYTSFDINGLVWKSMGHGKYNLSGAFRNFKAPTLIIDCRQDFLGEAVPISIHNEILASQLEFINECSHYPWIEKPQRYFKLIEEILKR